MIRSCRDKQGEMARVSWWAGLRFLFFMRLSRVKTIPADCICFARGSRCRVDGPLVSPASTYRDSCLFQHSLFCSKYPGSETKRINSS